MQPAVPIEEGSPTKEPCANIGFPGTAGEQSASGTIKSADVADAATDAATVAAAADTAAGAATAATDAAAGASIHAGPVPLYLVPQTISAEIHTHGGEISGISVQRTGQHFYAITLTRVAPQGIPAGEGGDGNAE